MATPTTDNQDVQELLPWYLNGTLDAADAERVRRHLDSDANARAEADDAGELLKAVAEDVAIPMLTHERVERLMARVDSVPQQAAGIGVWLARAKRSIAKLSAPSAYLPMAAVAALALLAVVIVMPQTPSQNAEFRTFSEERPAVAIQIEVANSLNAAQASALFAEYDLSAEAQESGLFKVSLSGDTSVTELYEVLKTLRADGRVVAAHALTEED